LGQEAEEARDVEEAGEKRCGVQGRQLTVNSRELKEEARSTLACESARMGHPRDV